MKKALILLIALAPICPKNLQAQPGQLKFRLLTSIPVAAEYFEIDRLQQVYLVSPTNEVIKYSSEGQELFRYPNNTLGRLAQMDATNPFSLLLYYPGFQTAITLDRTLNKIGELTLSSADLTDIQALAMANDNRVWLFDGGVYRIKLVDQEGNILRESDNLSLVLPLTPQIQQLRARDNLVIGNDPNTGLHVFDLFGQYVRSLPQTGIEDFQILDQQLLYHRDGKFYFGDLRLWREIPFPLPAGAERARQLRLGKDRLFVLMPDRLDIYTY